MPAAAAVLLAWCAVQGLLPRRVAVRVVGRDGRVPAALSGLTVDSYAFDDSGAGRYPPARLGRLQLDAEGGLILDADALPPGGIQLLLDHPERGLGWAHVHPNRARTDLELGEPQRLTGRILDTSDRGLSGAEVAVLTHRYGAALATAVTDAAGGFTVDGLSSSCGFLTLRASAEGYGMRDRDFELASGSVELRLGRTRPVVGRVVAPAGEDPGAWEVRLFRVPGVRAGVLADGSFYLDRMPGLPLRARLLVGNLPPGLTHRETLVVAGDADVRLEIHRACVVSGRVVDADGVAVDGAWVEHCHGAGGQPGVEADGAGRFSLGGVPPGPVTIEAFAGRGGRGRSARRTLHGTVELQVAEGIDVGDVVVELR